MTNSYASKNLADGEQIIYLAKVHWFQYFTPFTLVLIGFFTLHIFIGFIFLPIGAMGLIRAYIEQRTTDLAVTGRKVIAKWGLVKRSTIEQRVSKVDSILIDQSIIGRILNFGTITVTGSGITATPIKNIANPIEFRKAVESIEFQNHGGEI